MLEHVVIDWERGYKENFELSGSLEHGLSGSLDHDLFMCPVLDAGNTCRVRMHSQRVTHLLYVPSALCQSILHRSSTNGWA